MADVYRTMGRFEQAIAYAERALALNPNDPTVYRSMGNALNAVGRSTEAVEAIKKAMLLDPHNAVYYSTDLAGAYRHLGRYQEAVESLNTALARNPNWIPAYFELAMNYLMAWAIGQNPDSSILDRALEAAQKLKAFDEASLYAYFALPLVNLYKKQYDQAFNDAQKLVALAPENPDSYALMATVFISTGKSEEALAMMEKARQLNPTGPAWYLTNLALAYTLSDRQTEAEAIYKSVFEHHPSHADAISAHLELALMYIRSGREAEARLKAQALLKLMPDFSVEIWGQRNPNKNRAQIEQGMAALRKAGLN
jgi:tetratricopeptide (TPR) repeat protein